LDHRVLQARPVNKVSLVILVSRERADPRDRLETPEHPEMQDSREIRAYRVEQDTLDSQVQAAVLVRLDSPVPRVRPVSWVHPVSPGLPEQLVNRATMGLPVSRVRPATQETRERADPPVRLVRLDTQVPSEQQAAPESVGNRVLQV
jgi:hypothetical protein